SQDESPSRNIPNHLKISCAVHLLGPEFASAMRGRSADNWQVNQCAVLMHSSPRAGKRTRLNAIPDGFVMLHLHRIAETGDAASFYGNPTRVGAISWQSRPCPQLSIRRADRRPDGRSIAGCD